MKNVLESLMWRILQVFLFLFVLVFCWPLLIYGLAHSVMMYNPWFQARVEAKYRNGPAHRAHLSWLTPVLTCAGVMFWIYVVTAAVLWWLSFISKFP